jgi:hypothetical protein
VERSRVDLPAGLTGGLEVYVNGVPQRAGVDFDRVGDQLVFRRSLAGEGRLGFWRWLSLFLGVAGTYRKNDAVDVVYDAGGKRTVLTLTPEPLD